MLGKPGQHFEVGMVFGGLVRVGELLVLYVPFVAEKPVQRLFFIGTTGAIGWRARFYFFNPASIALTHA